nr:hypothetical protein [Burkholderia pseudomallei]
MSAPNMGSASFSCFHRPNESIEWLLMGLYPLFRQAFEKIDLAPRKSDTATLVLTWVNPRARKHRLRPGGPPERHRATSMIAPGDSSPSDRNQTFSPELFRDSYRANIQELKTIFAGENTVP